MEFTETDKERCRMLIPYTAHIFDFLVGVLIIADACVQFTEPSFGRVLLSLYFLCFGGLIVIFVFYVWLQFVEMIPFHFSYMGRGLVYLFLGVLMMGTGRVPTYDQGAGIFIILVAFAYIIVASIALSLVFAYRKQPAREDQVCVRFLQTCKVPRPIIQREHGLLGVHYDDTKPPTFDLEVGVDKNYNNNGQNGNNISLPPPLPVTDNRRQTLEPTNPFKNDERTEGATYNNNNNNNTNTNNPFGQAERRSSDAVEVQESPQPQSQQPQQGRPPPPPPQSRKNPFDNDNNDNAATSVRTQEEEPQQAALPPPAYYSDNEEDDQKVNNNNNVYGSSDIDNIDVSAYYGRPLNELETTEVAGYNAPIPTILLVLQKNLEESKYSEKEGIFSATYFAENQPTDPVYNTALALIKFFESLPEPFLQGQDDTIAKAVDVEAMPEVVSNIPEPWASILCWLFDVLARVAVNEEQNKMGVAQLARAFGPLCGPNRVTETELQSTIAVNALETSKMVAFFSRGIQWRIN